MYHTRELRWGIFLLALVALLLLLVFTLRSPISLPSEGAPCLGIPVVSLAEVENTLLCARDYDDCFLYNGEKAAIDTASKTIYIPQTIGETTTRDQLEGALTLSVSNRQLYFLQDTAFENLSQAVSQGHNFSLAVACGRHYHIYSVVFTTLPVIRMNSQTMQEEMGSVPNYFGDICLWDAETGTPVTSTLFYHARGGMTLDMDKKSWKLSLKTSDGKNHHLSLLGMGADDDWILNAMSMDDSKLKEKLMTTVWSEIVKNAPWNYPMSSCEYVELIKDNSYCGLYLLHRRVDQKFLDLSDEDILIKGAGMGEIDSFEEAYTIKYSPLSDEETASLMEGILTQQNLTYLDLENFIDINILLQFGSSKDNFSHKNMYYCLKKDGADYRLIMIPWDTDLTFGVTWLEEDNGYDYDVSLNQIVKRREYDQMAILHPDLEEKLSERWQQLRQDILSTQNLLEVLEAQIGQLDCSGAYAREQACWEPYYAGSDTQESVVRFVQERVKLLDAYYE